MTEGCAIRQVLSNVVATRHRWLFTFKLIKIQLYSLTLTTCQVHMWLVATVLDSADIEHFLHHGKFFWTALVWEGA